ncbi:MAG: topoisomerase DNA-binding C4 zinc finger domain-containing protein, partial [Muribaculaceae bacterium]|nr:topoisomerase DNA-binding C4 zinc finger domain-containing protein [Muribaculaceae bacterium]
VSNRGIFVIETKSHAGRITGGEHSQNWQQHFSSGSKNFYNPLLQNAAHIRILRRILPDVDENLFISMIAFTEAWRIEIKADDIVEERRFLPDRIIRRTLNPAEEDKGSWWRKGKEVRLDSNKIVLSASDLIAEIKRRKKIIPREELREWAQKIESAANYSNEAVRRHVDFVKERAYTSTNDIKNGICPRCGGQLVIKKSASGQFIGCENYPDCRFTGSIDLIH